MDETLLPNEIPHPRFGWFIVILLIILVAASIVSGFLLPLPAAGMICSGLFLAGLVWLFFALLWLMQRSIRWSLPRCIVMQDGTVQIQEPKVTYEFALSECRWLLADNRSDHITWFMPRCPAVIFCFPDHPYRVACGLDPDSLARWRGFLQLIELPMQQAVGWRRATLSGINGIVLGAVLGVAAGWLSWHWVPDAAWIVALGILGAIDGLLIALSWTFRFSLRKRIDFDGAALIFLKSAIIPLMIMGPRRGLGIRGAWLTVLIVAVLNGLLLLAVLIWIDWRKAKQENNSPHQA
jgi:hypothetical protein